MNQNQESYIDKKIEETPANHVAIVVEYDIWNGNTKRHEKDLYRVYHRTSQDYELDLLRIPASIERVPHVRSYTNDYKVVRIVDAGGKNLPLDFDDDD